MTTLDPTRAEWLSTLTDGELVANAPDHGWSDAPDLHLSDSLSNSQSESHLNSQWNTYQVIGRVLRRDADQFESLGADPVFLQRLNARLAGEKISPALVVDSFPAAVAKSNQPAANEAVFRWKLVAGLASVATCLVVVWNVVTTPDASTAAQLAQSRSAEQVIMASPQGPVVRDARLEEFMAAHKQLGGSSLQAPSGFLRNAGFENSPGSQR